MLERVNLTIEVLLILVGLRELYPWIKRRFWQLGAKDTPRSGKDLAVGSGLALLCGLLWSLSYVSLKYVSRSASAIGVVVSVFAWATLFCYVGKTFYRRRERRRGEFDQQLAAWDTSRVLPALLANLGNFGLSIFALYFISATQAMTLNNTSPLFLVLILLIRGKTTIRSGVIAPFLLLLLGAWSLLAGLSLHFVSGREAVGALIAVCGGAAFALWSDRIEDIESNLRLTSTRLQFLSVVFFSSYAVSITVAYLLKSIPILSLKDQTILAANGLRVALVYSLFQLAVRRAGPLLTTVVTVSQVPLTLGWEAILLGHPVTRDLMLGVLMVTAGAATLFIVEFEGRTKIPPIEAHFAQGAH